MHNGIPELGIPPLEPFTLDEIDIDMDNPEIGKWVDRLYIQNFRDYKEIGKQKSISNTILEIV